MSDGSCCFCDMEKEEKGDTSKVLSQAMQLPSYRIFHNYFMVWPPSTVSTQHGMKSSQPPPKKQHWGGGTGLEIPVLKLQRMSHENSARDNPWDDLIRINCKIQNICAVPGSHPNVLQLQECDEILWEVLPFQTWRHGFIKGVQMGTQRFYNYWIS